MYTATKTSFPKVSNFDMIVKIETSIDKLREIQKDCFTKIKNKFYRNIQLSSVESNYIWNLYYNFVIREYEFDVKKVKEITTFTTMNHVGMQMLNSRK
jgi:hypothetical protein